MRRQLIIAGLFVATITGCISTDTPPETGGVRPHYGKSFGPPSVPGVEGPYGTPISMAAPYNTAPPGSQYAARHMMSQNLPMNMVQMNPMGGPMGGPPGSMMPNPMAPGGMLLSPPGVPAMPGMPGGMPGMPPMPGMPGGMPGMPSMPSLPGAGANPFMKTSGTMTPDAGIVNANMPPGARPTGGVTQAQFANSSPVGSMFPAQRTQVYFGEPVRMKVYWYTQGPDGKPNYSTTPLETPGRYNFAQGAIYRLKLTNIPGRPALELYPTLEVVPTSPKTNEFLAHNSVPLDFTEEDFKQVVDRNYIVKVIYLPDPQFQDAAGAGPGAITSTQLDPGQDPIQEALRRGSILLVLRIGNIDQGLLSSPPTNAPIPSGPPMMMKPPGVGVPGGMQIPYNMMPIAPGMPGPFNPGMMPPGAIPPGAFPPGAPPGPFMPPAGSLPPGAVPPGFAPPSGAANPNPLPPLGPAPTPPLIKIPELTAPNKNDVAKPVAPPTPDAKPLDIPAPPLPPAVTPKTDNLPPLPTPGESKSSSKAPESQVVPAGLNPANEQPMLPVLPATPAATGDRPSLPPLNIERD